MCKTCKPINQGARKGNVRKGLGKTFFISLLLAIIIVVAVAMVVSGAITPAKGVVSEGYKGFSGAMPFAINSACKTYELQHTGTAVTDICCPDQDGNVWVCSTGKPKTGATAGTMTTCGSCLGFTMGGGALSVTVVSCSSSGSTVLQIAQSSAPVSGATVKVGTTTLACLETASTTYTIYTCTGAPSGTGLTVTATTSSNSGAATGITCT